MNSRLALKLEDNKERRHKEKILASLPPAWIELFENVSSIPSRDFLVDVPVNLNYDLRTQPLLAEKEITYVDYDDLNVANEYLKKSEMLLQPPVYIWFGEGPTFIVNKPVEIKLINEVHHLDDFKVYMMESDYSRGCVCAEYLGYLEKERITNNKEVVYEVMTFE